VTRRPTQRLLVLARDDDVTAAAVAAAAWARGVAVVRSDRSDLSATLRSERDGSCRVTLRRGEADLAVSAILNRTAGDDNSQPHASRPRAERRTRFQTAEKLAAWWAVLAQFPGPVVNRPSVHSFLPELDAGELGRRAGIAVAPRTLATRALQDGPRNVHRLHDGSHVGFFADGAADRSDEREVRRYTRFDPHRASYAIVAGRRLILIGSARRPPAGCLERLRAAVLDEGVAFAHLVLETTDVATLVHASAFPVLGNYRGQEGAVHHGLVEFLTAR
jgi:hypothetical protein